MREQEQIAWINGVYTAHAVATIGKKEFPKEPIQFFNFEENGQEKELTEEEKIMYRKKLIANLKIMQYNFESDKKKKQQSEKNRD